MFPLPAVGVWATYSHCFLLCLHPLFPSSARRRVGDPFTSVDQGPQVDADQFNKIMGYIDR